LKIKKVTIIWKKCILFAPLCTLQREIYNLLKSQVAFLFPLCSSVSAITKYAEAATDAGYNTSKPTFTNLVQNVTLWQEEPITVVCLTVWHAAYCTFSVTTPWWLKNSFCI